MSLHMQAILVNHLSHVILPDNFGTRYGLLGSIKLCMYVGKVWIVYVCVYVFADWDLYSDLTVWQMVVMVIYFLLMDVATDKIANCHLGRCQDYDEEGNINFYFSFMFRKKEIKSQSNEWSWNYAKNLSAP